MSLAAGSVAALLGFAPGAAAVEGARLQFALKPGQRLLYSQSCRSNSLSDARALFEQGTDASANAALAMDLRMDLRATMVVDVADRDAQGILLLVRWERLRGSIQANGQAQPAFLEAIRKELGKPILARLDDRGRITRVWLDPALDAGVQGTARMLVAELQCVLPEGAEAKWRTLELDAAGPFEVHYERSPRKPSAGLVRIRKRLVRNHPTLAKPVASELKVERGVAVEGTRRILFNASAGCLERLDAHEIHRTTIAGKLVAVSGNEFSLAHSRTTRLDPGSAAGAKAVSADLQARFPGTELFVELTPEEQEEAVQRKELGASTTGELFKALQVAEARGETDGRPLYLKLKALAAMRPETCAEMGQLLGTADPEGLAMHLLAPVLGAVGSPQAQEALAGAIRRRREEWPAQAVLLPALGQCSRPTAATIALLEELAYNSMQVPVASTAQLMLGTVAFNLIRQGSPGKAAGIVAAALTRLEHADDPALASRFLLCLGNAGSTEALPALKSWAGTRDPELRALAVFALRWIEDPEADRILLQSLGSDPAPEVRVKAVEALKFRSISSRTVALLEQAARADASPRARLAALGSLGDLRWNHPEVVAAIEAALEDPDEDVRKLAGSLLGRKQD